MRHHLTGEKARTAPRWAASVALVAAAAITLAACSSGNAAKGTGTNNTAGSTAKATGPVQVALILKNFTNPYFISMQNSAKADAAKLGVKLTVSAGQSDGDTSTQINAIDNAIAAGDAGIIITPNGNAVNPALDQAKAHLDRLDIDYQRNRPLASTGTVSREEFNKLEGDRLEAGAAVS